MLDNDVVVEIDSITASRFILALARLRNASSLSANELQKKNAPSNRQSAQIEGCG